LVGGQDQPEHRDDVGLHLLPDRAARQRNLLTAVYGMEPPDTVFTSSVFVRSTNGGTSWSRLALIAKHAGSQSYDEPSLYVEANGDVLIFIRTRRPARSGLPVPQTAARPLGRR